MFSLFAEVSNDILAIFSIVTIILLSLILAISVSPWFYIGWNKYRMKKKKKNSKETNLAQHIQEVKKAVEILREKEKGATFVIDSFDDASKFMTEGVRLDARITHQLLVNIFDGNKSPLHDGAVILKNGRVAAAASYITKVSDIDDLDSGHKYGTRHRSAIALSKLSNAVIVVISEETGNVTVLKNGKMLVIKKGASLNEGIDFYKNDSTH